MAQVAGLAALFTVDFGCNLLMTLGLVPAAGVQLPLLSHGARQVLYMAGVGLALSVFRRKDLIPAPASPGDAGRTVPGPTLS